VSARLDGKVVVVVGGDSGIGKEVAGGLADHGAAVAVTGPIGSLADAEAAMDAATAEHGPIDVVVHALVEQASLVPTPFLEFDEPAWEQRAEDPITWTLFSLQAAYARMRGRGGRIFVLTATASMQAASGLTGYVTAAEGQRSLVKAAARTWGAEGVIMNCIAVPVTMLAAGGPGEPSDRGGLPPAVLPAPDARTDVAGVIAALSGEEGKVVTGVTIAVDGGVWMTP
jgi:NAD(P)-dependent dehydrogenase (short-subunit alcohol dehydrogenase family)